MSVFVSKKALIDGFNFRLQWLSKDGEFDVLHSSKSYHANATLGKVNHHKAWKGSDINLTSAGINLNCADINFNQCWYKLNLVLIKPVLI